MSENVIQVQGLGKAYKISHQQSTLSRYNTLQEDLANAIRKPFARRESQKREMFWALSDVSFEVHQGTVLGIIGRNGAGKSTLLKILSRITRPTTGKAEIWGRIGSLLEVGTGFHPELTGRENIFLNGAILGMSRQEIRRQFDAIVTFAEVEQFLDTPVKRYSSGMYMRLAFAVAAHLEPEILVVDEVLAVGDAEFQRKSLGKMQEVADSGRTVLFVSHNMVAVLNLCTQALWLESGRIHEQGDVNEIVAHYVSSGASNLTERTWNDQSEALGNDAIRFHRMSVKPVDGTPSDLMTVVTPLEVTFEYWNYKPNARLNLSLVLENERGEIVFNTFPVREPNWHGKQFPVGLFRTTCIIPGYLLNDGFYNIEIYVVQDEQTVLFRQRNVMSFEIVDAPERRSRWYGKIIGTVHPQLTWTTEYVDRGQ